MVDCTGVDCTTMKMKDILERLLSGDYSAQDVLVAAGAVAVSLIVIRILIRLFRKKAGSQHFQVVECFNCGWLGNVSRYAGRCPQCNQALGEQKIRRGA